MCGSRKYPYHPHRRDQIFQGGRGSVCLSFQWGGGCTNREYSQRVLVTRKRVRNKEKTQKFTTTMYLRRRRINEQSKDISSVPWSDLSLENVPYGLPISNR